MAACYIRMHVAYMAACYMRMNVAHVAACYIRMNVAYMAACYMRMNVAHARVLVAILTLAVHLAGFGLAACSLAGCDVTTAVAALGPLRSCGGHPLRHFLKVSRISPH
jgi:hypothetical protein